MTAPRIGSPHPEFAGLRSTMLQLLVERDIAYARTRRREARNEAGCANLPPGWRYRVAPSQRADGVFLNIQRINIHPLGKQVTFTVAPTRSLIHHWLHPRRAAHAGVEEEPCVQGMMADEGEFLIG
jgi:hypothetical protein